MLAVTTTQIARDAVGVRWAGAAELIELAGSSQVVMETSIEISSNQVVEVASSNQVAEVIRNVFGNPFGSKG